MTRNLMVLIAAGGSAALMAGAYVFQALGYPPCAMCLWQRYPHVIAIVIGLLAWKTRGNFLPTLGAVAAATTGSIGFYHMGVERDWWEGPSSCTGSGGVLDGLDGAGLLAIEGPKVIMCDQVSWAFMSLSMPTWNGIFSFVLVGFWIAAIKLNDGTIKAG
ncbi:disulfide bond formation protein B [Yoonia sp. I 8.24]|uniref:disulfide bond formation protein B n=1 Tax=Yoonia sp. I 8.24 TaxID=1537229 RepID=UPI001EDF01E3|nr:disulfide bond formation protein B [Yoonia sp. I 8.24]MCG3267747.1 disulfide bond formation protein B [Yoonia sp. I 8.24]